MTSHGTALNYRVLDGLVWQYIQEEDLLELFPECSESLVPEEAHDRITRNLIEHVRRLILHGNIQDALELLKKEAEVVIADHRLLFRLLKQSFLEKLRSEEMQSVQAALSCARDELAPCALDAYPEAYMEFKHVLLALLFAKDESDTPVSHEWLAERRGELAAIVASTLRGTLRAYDAPLSLALRYLMSLHLRLCARQGTASPIEELIRPVLSEECDPSASPLESLLEAPSFNEADVQSLVQAADLSRQGAIDSLRFTHGDLNLAFKNELSRMRVIVGVLDDYVHEYCVYRGLVDGDLRPAGTSGVVEKARLKDQAPLVTAAQAPSGSPGSPGEILAAAGEARAPETNPTSGDSSHSVVTQAQAQGPDEASVSNAAVPEEAHFPDVAHREGSGTKNRQEGADPVLLQEALSAGSRVDDAHIAGTPNVSASQLGAGDADGMVEVEVSIAAEGGDRGLSLGSHSRPGSRVHAGAATCAAARNGPVGAVTQHAVGRWKPRNSLHAKGGLSQDPIGLDDRTAGDEAEARPDPRHFVEAGDSGLTTSSVQEALFEHGPFLELFAKRVQDQEGVCSRQEQGSATEKHRKILHVRRLVTEGSMSGAVDEVHRFDPAFFTVHPHLLFDLKQLEFFQTVERGDLSKAISIARSDLGPLAAKDSALFPRLKTTLSVLTRLDDSEDAVAVVRPSPTALAATLQATLGASVGLQEPRLMRLLRPLLTSHAEWFRAHMCSDVFADLLSIAALTESDVSGAPLSGLSDKSATSTGSVPSGSDASGSTPMDVDGPAPFDESAVLTLMEFMALSRGDAIQLLAQYGGSVWNVFSNLLA
eukprot:jgi/Mesen1/9283/ME000060S08715